MGLVRRDTWRWWEGRPARWCCSYWEAATGEGGGGEGGGGEQYVFMQNYKISLMIVVRCGCTHDELTADVGYHCRLSPLNDHQRPSVVVLCGRDLRGAEGVCCARHLAAHHVDTTLLLSPGVSGAASSIESEVRLYDLTAGGRTDVVPGTCPLSPDS